MPDRVMTFQQERTTGSKHVHACMHAPTNQTKSYRPITVAFWFIDWRQL